MSNCDLLFDAIAERAMVYYEIHEEISGRYGSDVADDVLRSAIRKHGRGFGRQLDAKCGDDFKALVNSFAFAPDDGKTFNPEVISLTESTAEIQMMTCPLKEAWLKAGLSPETTARLLYCASAIDEGTLDEVGIDAEIETWSPGNDGCCRLKLSKR